MSLPSGSRLGRFEVISRLGVGGMGQVYLARDTTLGRNLALKVLDPMVSKDPDRLARFRLEAVAASSLNHPNILTIYDIGEEDGTRFIATEYVDGETLREYLRSPRSLRQVVHVFIQVCSALSAAHDAGIVHRDIKPENVMVRRDGYVKVLDFGLAKLVDDTADAAAMVRGLVRTTPGIVVGTINYMSPEQAQGVLVDGRSDVWSTGVLLYEVVARRMPFPGSSPVAVFAAIMAEDPEPLSMVAPGTPEELERIVTRALRKDRAQRYQTAGDMLEDLKALQRRLELLPEPRAAAAAGAASIVTSPGLGPGAGGTRFASRIDPADTSGSFLSGELVRLVGREREVAQVVELLGREDVRLVTLTGPGGTGKTRLAQKVGRDLAAAFDDGVYWIDLSATGDPGMVAPAIAQALGVAEHGVGALAQALGERLRDRELLIVIDNFEQVADAAPLLVDLLAAAPGLKLLVTSRARLRLLAEHEVEVPPLDVPSSGEVPTAEALARVPSVRLFVERATAARSDFSLTAENAAAVAEIVRRLDGLPLAIELAAARARLLAPQQMLDRLRQRLRLLTGGARDLPARQQTMRDAVAWSYDLLDEAERTVFRRMSVFAGGCTLDAVEAIDRAVGGAADLLDAIESLVSKSLVRQRAEPGGEPRFRMLEVVREFGLEYLDGSGEGEAVARAHAEYYLGLAERAAPELVSEDPSGWLERLDREHDNLAAALEWAFSHGSDVGPRLAAQLARFWGTRGYCAEGRKWLEEAVSRTEGERTPLRSKLLASCGYVVQMQRDRYASLPRFEESLEIARELGDKTLISAASIGIGIASTDFGDFERARSSYEQVLDIAREIGDARLAFHALNNMGEVARGAGDYGQARAYYEEALASEPSDTNEWAGYAHLNLGAVAYYEERYADMPAHFAKSLEAFTRTGDRMSVATALSGLGAHAAATGRAERAARLAGAVEAICAALGGRLDISDEVFFAEWRERARAALGDAGFEAAESEGRRMGVEQAAAYAVAEAGAA